MRTAAGPLNRRHDGEAAAPGAAAAPWRGPCRSAPGSVRIVLATDFSEEAARAGSAAVALARCLGDSLVFVHAVETYPNEPGERAAEIDEASRRLRALADEVRASGVDVEERLLVGVPDETVADVAKQLDARLIVAGARGHGALWDLFVGSVGGRVVDVAACPVLLLRDGRRTIERWAAGEHRLAILAAASSVGIEGLMRPLEALRLAGPCDVTIVHVAAGPGPGDRLLALVERELRARTAEFAGAGAVSVRVALDPRPIAGVLSALVHADDFDLVVIGAPRQMGVDVGPATSLARELLHRRVSPILCVPRYDLALQRGSGPPFRVILAATDFGELGDRAVAFALALAKHTSGTRVILCHVVETPRPAAVDLSPDIRAVLEARLAQRMPGASILRTETTEALVIARRTAAAGIVEAAERLSVNIVCIGSQRRGAIGRLLLGSVAAEVIQASHRPILIVR